MIEPTPEENINLFCKQSKQFENIINFLEELSICIQKANDIFLELDDDEENNFCIRYTSILKEYNSLFSETVSPNLVAIHKINCLINKSGDWHFCDCSKHKNTL